MYCIRLSALYEYDEHEHTLNMPAENLVNFHTKEYDLCVFMYIRNNILCTLNEIPEQCAVHVNV